MIHSPLLVSFLLGFWQLGNACDRTDLTLLSLLPGPGPNMTLTTRLCIGGGVTGALQGANGDTRSVGFGFYRTPNVSPVFSVISFSPATMVGDFAGCTMPGANIGPQGPPYNVRQLIFYADPGYYMIPPCVVSPYQCVTTTALCGNIRTQCTTFTFVINATPDSLRAFGAEGMGNPVAGCYPSDDMVINFGLLPVTWGEISARQVDNSVKLGWTTLQETNTDYFVVERSSGDGEFVPVAEVQASFNSANMQKYSVVDLSPNRDRNLYRIRQVDKDLKEYFSPSVEVFFQGPEGFSWGNVGPVPTHGDVSMTFFNEHRQSLQMVIVDMAGKVVVHETINAREGTNTVNVAMSRMEAGVYFVRIKGAQGSLDKKLVKL